MIVYSFKRIISMLPIILVVNLLTFILFFSINSPDDLAKMQLGHKYVDQAAIDSWKETNGYNYPIYFNEKASGLSKITETLVYKKNVDLLKGDFGRSISGRDINRDIKDRMWPSLSIAIPTFFLSFFLYVGLAFGLVLVRLTSLETIALGMSIVFMSVSGIVYIIFSQYLFGYMGKLVPISGYSYHDPWRFLFLPIFTSLIIGLGAGVRWYRAIFLDEISKNYVVSALSRGLSTFQVLYLHVLPASMMPILTQVIASIPFLFMGSLLVESFFGIPGLGSYVIDAIGQQDFEIVRVMVFLSTFLYMLGLLLTDITYVLFDPRVKLGDGR